MKTWALPTVVMLAVLAVSCGGGSNSSTPAPTPTPTPQISNGSLASMPLSAADLGSEFTNLPVDDTSGYQTSSKVASDTIDPSDTAADIENMGWVISYKLGFADPALNALTVGHGAFSGGSSFDLFKDDQSAASFLTKQLADIQRFKGQALAGGVTLVDSTPFTVSTGDQGFGLKDKVTLGGTTAYGWIAGYRVGRLLATIQVQRADGGDIGATIVQLVNTLQQRVTGVLSGTIKATPVPIPTKTPGAVGEAPRPSHGPYPDAMALTLSDLPTGTTVDAEGYVPASQNVSFERKFSAGGNSSFLGLENDIDLYPDANGASGFFGGQRALFTGSSAQDFFTQVFKGSVPFQTSNLVVTQATITPSGDDSFAVVASYTTPAGSLENEFVFVRIRAVVATLIFTEPKGALSRADVDALVSTMLDHIAQGLSAG